MLVDCISSLGAMEFKMEGWQVDAAITASQKGLMTPREALLVIAVFFLNLSFSNWGLSRNRVAVWKHCMPAWGRHDDKRISTKSSYNPVQDARQAGLLAMDPKVGMILTFTFGIIFATNLRASF